MKNTVRLFALALLLCVPMSQHAAPAAAPQKATNPLWQKLWDGNQAFQGNAITFDGLKKLRGDLANGQKPPFLVLSCSDSRVPPELVFKQNLGDVFLVRSAGNVTDTLGIASMEYAIAHDWTKLLVILAHEKCGAIEEAIKTTTPDTPNLAALVWKIRESFVAPCTPNTDCWTLRTRQNAIYVVEDLKRRSAIIKRAIDGNKLPVVVAYYKLDGTLVVWKTIN